MATKKTKKEIQEKPVINDFTGFGFVHVSHRHATIDFEGMAFGGLYGWGWTPLEAYMRSIEAIDKVFGEGKIEVFARLDYSIIRVTPAAMAYLERFGFDLYPSFEEVQFTIDELGNPVTHVLDIQRFFENVLERINSELGKSEFEKNDVDKIDEKNNMEKSNFSTYEVKNGIDVTGWYFAAEFERKILGIGSTPAIAMKNAIDYAKKSKMKNRSYFELETTIRPMTPRAKKYIDAFGLDTENTGVIEVPLSLTPTGYPFKYIVDLVTPKGIKIAETLESITR